MAARRQTSASPRVVAFRGADLQEGSGSASDPHLPAALCSKPRLWRSLLNPDFGAPIPDLSTGAPWEEKEQLLQDGSFALPVAGGFVLIVLKPP